MEYVRIPFVCRECFALGDVSRAEPEPRHGGELRISSDKPLGGPSEYIHAGVILDIRIER